MPSKLVKLDILLNGDVIDALSFIVHADKAYERARKMAEKLKEHIPRQMFEIPIQAAVGGKIIARETIKALAQGRPREVLRRRYHPKEEAAREAEGGQEAHESLRYRRGSAGGVHGCAQAR